MGLNYAFQGIILTWMSFLKKVLLFYMKNGYLFLFFIFKCGVEFFFSCDNIGQMDDEFIANETYQSDSRNYIELDRGVARNNYLGGRVVS